MKLPLWLALPVFVLLAPAARADDIACISTTFRLLGANDKVCISAFDDPKVPGVTCHISQARTGGVKGSLGLAEDPSRFSIACRQTGPITADISKLSDDEKVYSDSTSLFFKHTHVFRTIDKHARLCRHQRPSCGWIALQRDLDGANHAVERALNGARHRLKLQTNEFVSNALCGFEYTRVRERR